MKMGMKMLGLIAGLAMMSAGAAQAADLPPLITKATVGTVAPCSVASASTPLSCSGFYVGAGLAGQGSNADILGSGINGSVFAGGMVPSGAAGYQFVNGNWLFGAEYDLGYAVGSNLSVNGVGSNVNGLRMSEFFKVGGNLAGLLGVQTPITVPAALANSVLGLYAGVGAAQWWFAGAVASGTSSGAGVLFDISPRWFGDLRYTYTNFNGAKANGVTVNNDQSLRIGLNYKLN
jgi:opacity protein-like surface antigen